MRLLSIQELPQSGRVKLVFDDETVLKTQPYLLADFGLYSGMELSEEDYQALLAAAGKASARARAVRIVAAAGVSERELQKRLVQKGEEAADAKEAVGWLKELHLLDDGETARKAMAKAASKISCMRRGSPRNSGTTRSPTSRRWTMPSTVFWPAAGRGRTRTTKK